MVDFFYLEDIHEFSAKYGIFVSLFLILSHTIKNVCKSWLKNLRENFFNTIY